MERGERAERIFNEGFNCCQAVVLAFADLIKASYGLDETTLASMCSGFGGGFGRLREVCGAVSGMTMMAGFIQPAADPSVKSDRTANYALVQEFAATYRKENGSIVCRELLGLSAASRPASDASVHGIPAAASAAVGTSGHGLPVAASAAVGTSGHGLPVAASAAVGTSGHGLPVAAESPVPSDRTPEYYRKRPCGKLVNMAASIVATHLASMA